MSSRFNVKKPTTLIFQQFLVPFFVVVVLFLSCVSKTIPPVHLLVIQSSHSALLNSFVFIWNRHLLAAPWRHGGCTHTRCAHHFISFLMDRRRERKKETRHRNKNEIRDPSNNNPYIYRVIWSLSSVKIDSGAHTHTHTHETLQDRSVEEGPRRHGSL